MKRDRFLPRALVVGLGLWALGLSPFAISLAAAETPAPAKKAAETKPIRALLVVGGCCHDYTTQKLIISEGTAARARIEWTLVQQGGTATNSRIPLYEKADWAKGYDIVVHAECFSDVKDPKYTETILKPHREGIPAIVIHCAMHCYRDGTGEWFNFCGVTSHRHGGHYAFDVENRKPEHPVMKGFGSTWKTPKGELYWISELKSTATPLGIGKNTESNKDEVCIWTNQFGKGKVLGTTIGHYNEEMADPKFLDMLTRGILWATDKKAEDYLLPFDATQTKFRWETQVKPAETKEPPVKK